MDRALAAIFFCMASAAVSGPSERPEEVLHTFAKAYATGDIALLAGCFSGNSIFNGMALEKKLFQFNRFFQAPPRFAEVPQIRMNHAGRKPRKAVLRV